ncbi:zinc finger MYM-type protein 2-like [Amphiura filiformis]|uniref:zinc finger MYM-type protein 2-like n=1 Tax=Amphiura filiformis TaxID=82378 RepID=UPI003B215AD0
MDYSDSDDSLGLFLTQNSFRDEEKSPITQNLATSAKRFEPIVSDVSDDGMISATVALEEDERREEGNKVSSRFGTPKRDEEMNNVTRRRLAPSTEKKVKWATDLFREWQLERNTKAVYESSLNISPIDVDLDDMTRDELNYSLSRFICEVKKVNGEDYPGETLHELVICVQLHFDLIGKPLKFLSDPDFLQVKNTLDSVMQDRAKLGLGIRRKQAQVITVQEEERLWQQNVLGCSNPTQMLNTLFYLIGLNFALRGGQEHRDLRWKNSQIQMLTNENEETFLRYTEDASKTNRGGLKHRKLQPKVVDAYENKKDRSRCIVTIFKKYEYHCPPEDKRPDALYLRPLVKPRGAVWFTCQPLGRHKLANIVANICKQGGLGGYRTNHSLRATAASRLYDQAIDEQLIGLCKMIKLTLL